MSETAPPVCTVCGKVASQQDIDGCWWPPCEHPAMIGLDVLRYATSAPAPDAPAAREVYQPIPILTGCCIACGDRLDITQGPVNDVTCVRVRPHCACNQGVHLWQSLAAASPRTRNE